MLPPPMQSSLPAGWLAFSGRELNPLDRYKRFQITFSSPFSGLILAQRKFHGVPPLLTLKHIRIPGPEEGDGETEPDHLKRISLDGYELTHLLFPAHDGRALFGLFVPRWHDCPCSFLLRWACSSPHSTNWITLDCFGRDQYLDYVHSRFLTMVAMDGNGHPFIYRHCFI